MLERKLRIIQSLQDKYPDLHVGGSIGLFLHGFDLKRDISDSDIDLAKSIDDINRVPDQVTDHFSDGCDFTYRIEKNGINYEIKIAPEQEFEIKYYQGVAYRVTKLETILFYKKDYAEKGYEKHIKDMEVINSYSLTIK
jgi:hypothetical protein